MSSLFSGPELLLSWAAGWRYLPACSPPTGGSSPHSARGSSARRCSRSPWGRRQERAGWRCRLCHLGRLRGRTHTVSRGNAGDWAPSQTTEKRREQRPLRGAVSTTTQPGPGCHTNIHTPPTGPAGPQGTARSRTRCWAGLHSPSPHAVAPFSYGFYRYYIQGNK